MEKKPCGSNPIWYVLSGFFSARTHLRIDIKNELHNNREVKSMEDKLLEELNQLLKGTHMGASIFEDLREKIKSETLHKEFDEILLMLHIHEKSLTGLILAHGGEPIDSAGIMGTITDVISHIKNLTVDSDKEVLKVAVHNMEMGAKALHDFDARNFILDDETEKTIAIHATDIHFQQFRRNSPWNVEQLSKLSEKLEELSQKKD